MAYDIFGGGGGGTIDGIARAAIGAHTNRQDNPHTVTKVQVGLSNVDNTSDLNKPISSLTQTALDFKADGTIVTAHNTNTSNPHNVTKTQIGLDNVANVDTTTTANIADSADKRFVSDAQKVVLENTSGANTGDETNATIISKIGYTPENTLNKGVNNGYCGLDSGGKVPLQNLPSTLLKYIGTWNASTNTPALTNPDLTKTSWVYEVTTAGTRFGEDWKPGDWLIYNADGVAEKSDNSDDVVSVNGKTGVVVISKADVGLSNVDNTSDLDKPISTLTQTALNLKADSTIVTTHTTNTNNPHNVTKTQVGLGNVVNVNTSVTTNITDTSSKRFVSDVEKTTWNSKKDMLPEITQRTTTPAEWYSVAYGNGIFVAIASSGTHRVMRSTDGVTWTAVAVSLDTWASVAYGNGIFVAVASSGTNRVMRSTDGVTWTAVAVSLDAWASVAYGNGIFVAVATTGANRVMWSTDAVNWYYKNIPLMTWHAIGYGGGMFIALALNSSDGLLTIGNRTYSDKCQVIKKSVIGELSTTILSTEWTGTEPFEDTIPITIAGEQITNTTHDIQVALILSNDINVARQEQESYSYFSKGEISATNTLKITCFDYKPSVNLNLLLEVVKKW